MKGWCPDCDTLQTITPTGKPIGEWGSATWKKLVDHSDESKTVNVGGVVVETQCSGSGKKI